jgi:hypothetical protein
VIVEPRLSLPTRPAAPMTTGASGVSASTE